MNIKIFVLSMVMLIPILEYGQTPVNKVIPVNSGQKISMHFDYPELVRISTWDKTEISIQGTVSINEGENDDAFELLTSSSGNTISIKNEIKNMKDLPQRITLRDGAQKIVFRNKEELKKYKETHGLANDNRMSYGFEMEIILEIKVPRNVETTVEAEYGIVEIKDYSGPLTVNATYGGVDANLTERSIGEITATTNYGEIYSDLDTKLTGDASRQGDFRTYVSAKPGTVPKYNFDSEYGNVYLRKAK